MAISLLVAGQSAASISWKPSRDMGEDDFSHVTWWFPWKNRLFGLAARNRLSLSLPLSFSFILFHSLLRSTSFLSQYKISVCNVNVNAAIAADSLWLRYLRRFISPTVCPWSTRYITHIKLPWDYDLSTYPIWYWGKSETHAKPFSSIAKVDRGCSCPLSLLAHVFPSCASFSLQRTKTEEYDQRIVVDIRQVS